MIRYSTSRFNSMKTMENVAVFDSNYGVRKEFDKALVDESYYVPATQEVKAQKGRTPTKGVYDFADGVDTGSNTMLIGRKPGYDIAEVQEAVEQLEQNAKQLYDKDVEEFEKQKSENIDSMIQSVAQNAVENYKSGVNTTQPNSNN